MPVLKFEDHTRPFTGRFEEDVRGGPLTGNEIVYEPQVRLITH